MVDRRIPGVVQVTPAQVAAARLKVQRAASSGKTVEPGVHAIANARKVNDGLKA